MNRKMMKKMMKELSKIRKNTDYSNYRLHVTYDEITNTFIIPKPVMALAMVDLELHNKLFSLMEMHDNYNVIVA